MNLFEPKELKRFKKALKKGDYHTAISLERSENIPESLVQEAKERLKLEEAINAYGQDSEKTDYFDRTLKLAMDRNIVSRIRNKNNQFYILMGRFRQALVTGDIDNAISIIKSIPDHEGQFIGFCRIASYISNDSNKLDKVIELLLQVPVEIGRDKNLRSLSYSRIILKDFSSAKKIVEKITNPEIKNYVESLISFVERYHNEKIEEVPKFPYDFDNSLVQHALICATQKDFDGMEVYLNKISYATKPAYYEVTSESLAYAGYLDASINLAKKIPDQNYQNMMLLVLLLHYNFSRDVIHSLCVEISKNSLSQDKKNLFFLVTILLESALSNQMLDVAQLLRDIKDEKTRNVAASSLVDLSYSLIKAERGNQNDQNAEILDEKEFPLRKILKDIERIFNIFSVPFVIVGHLATQFGNNLIGLFGSWPGSIVSIIAFGVTWNGIKFLEERALAIASKEVVKIIASLLILCIWRGIVFGTMGAVQKQPLNVVLQESYDSSFFTWAFFIASAIMLAVILIVRVMR